MVSDEKRVGLPMKNASVKSMDDAVAALHVFHRDGVWRAPWDGPAAPASND